MSRWGGCPTPLGRFDIIDFLRALSASFSPSALGTDAKPLITASFLRGFLDCPNWGALVRPTRRVRQMVKRFRQFRRWILAVLWEYIMDALKQSGAVPSALQMIDSTVIRARHQAVGAKGGLHNRVLAVLELASRPRCTFSSMHMGGLPMRTESTPDQA